MLRELLGGSGDDHSDTNLTDSDDAYASYGYGASSYGEHSDDHGSHDDNIFHIGPHQLDKVPTVTSIFICILVTVLAEFFLEHLEHNITDFYRQILDKASAPVSSRAREGGEDEWARVAARRAPRGRARRRRV